MKRRFMAKRRRKVTKLLADMCSAKHLCAEDRKSVFQFAEDLKRFPGKVVRWSFAVVNGAR